MARSRMCMMLLIALPVALMACAQGFQGNDDDPADDDDDPVRVDAPIVNPGIDAPASIIDAPTSVIDAPGLPIDAPGLPVDGPVTGACTTDTECGAGMCCLGQLTCVAGTATGLPVPFNCLPD